MFRAVRDVDNPSLWFGVDYYPEHWPKDRWRLDAELMSSAGFNVVRLAEFAWCRLEPSPGRFDFQWLDESINLLAERNIRVVLGTPTASPPSWLVKLHPDILPLSYRGHRMPPVARRHYCPNNPNYLRAVERIVTAMAEHYRENENVVGYQIDNELSLGEEYCYCEYCISLFREWLKRKYGDIRMLNEAYGTVFWSHEYRDWAEIHPPTPPLDRCNRGLALDWLRFRSESFIRFLEFQVEIIRSVSPNKKVTTNLMGLYPEIDYYKLSERLDFPSWDCYPKFGRADYDPAWVSMLHDATRCMGNGVFWVMELQAGPTDGYSEHPIGVTPDPGELRKWLYQAIARGADGVVYFRWRTACFGKEQYWHGILNHDGEINRRYLEVKQVGDELRRIGNLIADTKFKSQVGLIFSYDAFWATLVERNYYATTYHEQVLMAYRGFWRHGVGVDVIPPHRELKHYKVLLAPFLYLTGTSLTEKLRNYVEDGGILVATARTSVKDENNRVYSDGLPGGLRDVFGIKVTDYTPLPSSREANIVVNEARIPVVGWLEELTVSTAKVLGVHDYRWLKGKPALTVNRYGKGYAVYIGGFLSRALVDKIANELVERRLVITPVKTSRYGVEIAAREGDGYRLLFLINHEPNTKDVEMDLDKVYEVKGLLKGVSLRRKRIKLRLNPHDVEILQLKY